MPKDPKVLIPIVLLQKICIGLWCSKVLLKRILPKAKSFQKLPQKYILLMILQKILKEIYKLPPSNPNFGSFMLKIPPPLIWWGTCRRVSNCFGTGNSDLTIRPKLDNFNRRIDFVRFIRLKSPFLLTFAFLAMSKNHFLATLVPPSIYLMPVFPLYRSIVHEGGSDLTTFKSWKFRHPKVAQKLIFRSNELKKCWKVNFEWISPINPIASNVLFLLGGVLFHQRFQLEYLTGFS